jgi:hypothetical protein
MTEQWSQRRNVSTALAQESVGESVAKLVRRKVHARRSAAFVLEVEPTEFAHAARAVAVAPAPPRASEVAEEMNGTTQKA